MKHLSPGLDEHPVDAVITWVDSNKNGIKKRIAKYASQAASGMSSEEYEDHRYASGNEIIFCIMSIIKNAAFIRRIYIVTDGQQPPIGPEECNIPDTWQNRIKVVDHREIFSGLTDYLPTFNSLSIETVLHRIPGLSEHYIYFNDDFFILRKTTYADFFNEAGPISRGYLSRPGSMPVRYDTAKARNSNTVGFVIPMVNASRAIHKGKEGTFVRLFHAPYAFRKSTLVDFFETNQALLVNNIRHRFRSYEQFSVAALSATLEWERSGWPPDSTVRHVYVKPIDRFTGYCQLKLLPYAAWDGILFACIQSMTCASDQVRAFLEHWLWQCLQGDG